MLTKTAPLINLISDSNIAKLFSLFCHDDLAE